MGSSYENINPKKMVITLGKACSLAKMNAVICLR